MPGAADETARRLFAFMSQLAGDAEGGGGGGGGARARAAAKAPEPEPAQPRWRSAPRVAAGQRRSAAEARRGGHQTDGLALIQRVVRGSRGQGGQQVGERGAEMDQQQRIPGPSEPEHR